MAEPEFEPMLCDLTGEALNSYILKTQSLPARILQFGLGDQGNEQKTADESCALCLREERGHLEEQLGDAVQGGAVVEEMEPRGGRKWKAGSVHLRAKN